MNVKINKLSLIGSNMWCTYTSLYNSMCAVNYIQNYMWCILYTEPYVVYTPIYRTICGVYSYIQNYIVTRLYDGLTYLQNNKKLLKDLFKYYYVEADILNPLCNI